MTGSSIVTPANKRGVYYNVYCSLSCIGFPEMNLYKVKTALVHHIEDDPLYKCKIYNEKNTYNDCIENELEVHSTISCCPFKNSLSQEMFLSLLDCVPIWFTDDISKTCSHLNLTTRSKVKQTNMSKFMSHYLSG